jgi:hypothetical protein
VARVLRLAFGALADPNPLLLLSTPAVPFFATESRIDLTLASLFLAIVRRGRRPFGKLVVLNMHDVRSMQIPAFGVTVAPEVLAMYERLERRTFGSADFVLAAGEGWPACLERRYGVPLERIVAFPNGNVRYSDLPPSPIPDSAGLKLVCAGTMGQPGRQIDDFVAQFAAVRRPDVSLYLLGPGGPREPRGPWADPRVHYLGPLPLAECIAAVRSCDVGVYPYPDRPYFDLTHTTNKMALYLTCGVSLLARDAPYVTEFVRRHDLGTIYDDASATQAIETLGDPATLARQRANAAAIGNGFYWDVIVDRALRTVLERAALPQRWPRPVLHP